MKIYWKFVTILWRVFTPLIRFLGWEFYAPFYTRSGKIDLITSAHFSRLPEGVTLICIDGSNAVKGTDRIDDDTRGGFLAYGFPSDRRSMGTYIGRRREK